MTYTPNKNCKSLSRTTHGSDVSWLVLVGWCDSFTVMILDADTVASLSPIWISRHWVKELTLVMVAVLRFEAAK